jgi:hypothetical protein
MNKVENFDLYILILSSDVINSENDLKMNNYYCLRCIIIFVSVVEQYD